MICIGIDESYKDTGITVNYDNGKKLLCYSVKGTKEFKIKTKYRNHIRFQLTKIIQGFEDKKDVVIVVERIRQFSGRFISMDYIKSMSALVASIVDEAYEFNVPVYSVDTRNWKSNIIGTSKPKKNSKKIDAKKYPTYEWCRKNKFKQVIEDGKYNDNIGDSIAISFTWWNSNCKNKLKIEQ